MDSFEGGRSGSSSGIFRANINGTNTEELIPGGSNVLPGDSPSAIALDLGAGKIYWGNVNDDTIYRADLDGTGIVGVVTSGISNPSGIALDVNAT